MNDRLSERQRNAFLSTREDLRELNGGEQDQAPAKTLLTKPQLWSFLRVELIAILRRHLSSNPTTSTTRQSHTEPGQHIRACPVNLLATHRTQSHSRPTGPAAGASQPHNRSSRATANGEPRKVPHTSSHL